MKSKSGTCQNGVSLYCFIDVCPYRCKLQTLQGGLTVPNRLFLLSFYGVRVFAKMDLSAYFDSLLNDYLIKGISKNFRRPSLKEKGRDEAS